MNKLEKYIKNNYIGGSVRKVLGSWILYPEVDFNQNKEYVLGNTIDESLVKIKQFFPEEERLDRKELLRNENKQ